MKKLKLNLEKLGEEMELLDMDFSKSIKGGDGGDGGYGGYGGAGGGYGEGGYAWENYLDGVTVYGSYGGYGGGYGSQGGGGSVYDPYWWWNPNPGGGSGSGSGNTGGNTGGGYGGSGITSFNSQMTLDNFGSYQVTSGQGFFAGTASATGSLAVGKDSAGNWVASAGFSVVPPVSFGNYQASGNVQVYVNGALYSTFSMSDTTNPSSGQVVYAAGTVPIFGKVTLPSNFSAGSSVEFRVDIGVSTNTGAGFAAIQMSGTSTVTGH